MTAKAPFINREIVLERQQYGRNDACGNEGRMARHAWSPDCVARLQMTADASTGGILADRWAGRTGKNPARAPRPALRFSAARNAHTIGRRDGAVFRL